jgi:hypothetical protein
MEMKMGNMEMKMGDMSMSLDAPKSKGKKSASSSQSSMSAQSQGSGVSIQTSCQNGEEYVEITCSNPKKLHVSVNGKPFSSKKNN